MDGRYEHTRERKSVQLLDQIQHEFGMDARPPVRENLPVADICRDNNGARENAAHLRKPVGVFQRTSPNYYALRSVIQGALNELPAAYPSSQLDFDVSSSKDGLDCRLVVSATRNRIQIDEVKVSKAVLSPSQGDSYRIGYSNDLLVVRTSGELNTSSASEVERRNRDHLARRLIEA
jgi:hypothetical protein